MRVPDKRDIRGILNRLGVKPEKSRGQNFLFDQNALHTILEFSKLKAGESVLEIGAGLGAFTELLIAKKVSLKIVEIEPRFAEFLREQYPELSGSIIAKDIRELALSDLYEPAALPITVVGNLPYSMSTDIILWVLENRAHISSASFLLQREFAERIAADPGGRDYGAITVRRALFAEAELGEVISGDAFFPSTEVDSRLIRLTMLTNPSVELDEENDKIFRQVVRAAFSSRRKMLSNSLGSLGLLSGKEQVQEILKEAGIDGSRRAETLSVSEFASLAVAVRQKNKKG